MRNDAGNVIREATFPRKCHTVQHLDLGLRIFQCMNKRTILTIKLHSNYNFTIFYSRTNKKNIMENNKQPRLSFIGRLFKLFNQTSVCSVDVKWPSCMLIVVYFQRSYKGTQQSKSKISNTKAIILKRLEGLEFRL